MSTATRATAPKCGCGCRRDAGTELGLVHDSPELHRPEPPSAHGTPLIPDDLWLRSERQTLRRLPSTGAILFTIRTQQAPLAVLATRPDVAAAMATTVRSWSDDLVTYQSAHVWRAAVLTLAGRGRRQRWGRLVT